ncbi:MAG TPA: hypothetical protein VL968_00390, partial [Rhodocyclaceae bacterium]|nr:hypothetical protein [Rhodocyclaceae bacterium]
IVALTASAFEEDKEKCLAAGMDGFIAKPLDLDRLLAALHQWALHAPAPATTEDQAAAQAVAP